ncbi:efflux RND transporter permease subunit [sulfur-oxidizing endosymbiont of Gigantopelta aegis]|uniref:efflux RND transporter permease subunit n=1 Tax=sulfur-oxidizing endosymbiont of Gigantopelta aegis TaxID=2794934 RepID=UPI0018DC2AAA|nr:efflux RND transporter permease subunit [sulfur-oxidizing endosymbiont of Gigantopelta aegis]
MNGMIVWFANNRVAANLLMLFILAAGLLTLPQIRKELYPALSLDKIVIAVPYPGASAEEIEKSIIIKIEEAIQGLPGVENISSLAKEGMASVTIEVEDNSDVTNVLNEVKNQIDAIPSFPKDAEEPIIKEKILKIRTISIAVSGDTDEKTLKKISEKIRDDIVALPGVSQADLSNVRPYEIGIEISEYSLNRYQLTIKDVVKAIRNSSIDLPSGAISSAGGEVLLKTNAQAFTAAEFEEIIVLTTLDGTRLTIGDIATVKDGFVEEENFARFNGKPAAMIRIFRVGDQDILELSKEVRDYVKEENLDMPENIYLTTWLDESSYFKGRLDILFDSAVYGFLLVLIVLLVFLRFRLAFWVSLGIPVSFLGAFWLMPLLGVSFNEISLFALILVLGILVDDAIIVGESIHHKQENGMPGLQGAIEGTKEVAKPLTFSVLTTMVAFSPVLFLPGITGNLYQAIPIVIILTLFFSLIESMFILPAHLSMVKEKNVINKKRSIFTLIHETMTTLLESFILNVYRPILEFCLSWRYLILAFFISIFMITMSVVSSGWVRMVFYPDMNEDILIATLTLPQGTPIEDTAEIVNHIERSLIQVTKEFDEQLGFPKDKNSDASLITKIFNGSFFSSDSNNEASGYNAYNDEFSDPLGNEKVYDVLSHSVVRNTMSVIGEHNWGGRWGKANIATHLGEVNVELNSFDDAELSISDFLNRWREVVGEIPEAVELKFDFNSENQKESINIELSSADHAIMPEAAQLIKNELVKYDGVYDIVDSYRLGKEEIQIAIKPNAENLGLSIKDLAQQIRQGFHGIEAQRIQRGKDDIRVIVRYPKKYRRSIVDIENMFIRTPDGAEIPFSAVADVSFGRGLADIQRNDRKRTLQITASIDSAVASSKEIMLQFERTQVFNSIEKKYPGLSIGTFGAQKAKKEFIGTLARNFLLALIVIYALMAIPFSSYLQPLIVMTAIPFGFVGAIYGHMIIGIDLSLLSMTGIVAVTGIVVNDSLVLMDYINKKRLEGQSINRAIRTAGVVRFRPILLTSITTFVGLTPLMMETNAHAQHLIPMAVSMAYGVAFATIVTLILVPVCYAILYDIIDRFKVSEDDNLFDFTSTTDLVKKFVHGENEPAFALSNSELLFDDSFEVDLDTELKNKDVNKKTTAYKKQHVADSVIGNEFDSDSIKTENKTKGIVKDIIKDNIKGNVLADQEETELDKISRSIEREVSIIKKEQAESQKNEEIEKYKFDKMSNFESLIQSKIDSFKFETNFSEISFVVPSNDDFDFFIYQVIMGNQTIFEQYRVPDEHAQFFDRLLQKSQIVSINGKNYSQFERFMSHELKGFIATDSFIIMSVYLMGHPMGIIYAVPKDPDKQFSQSDHDSFQQLSTHFYKGIETMVDIV